MHPRSAGAAIARRFFLGASARQRRRLAVRLVAASVLVGSTVTRPVHAEERAEILAEASFADGVKLMHADRCPEAIEKFEESQRLDPASGTALDLAYCQARLGKIAAAWLTYRQAITLADAQGKAEHARIARTEADKLETDLPRLTLVVPERAGLRTSVELDGAPLANDLLSVPIPVDPGAHEVAVDVNGSRAWTTQLTIARRERLTVSVPLGDMDAAAARTAGGPARTSEPRHASGPSPSLSGATPKTDAQGTWALVVGGVGAATVVAGAALFTSARLEYDGVGDHCTGNACDDEGYSARVSAASRARVSYAVLAAGTALVGASVVLWLTRNHGAPSSALTLDGTESSFGVGYRRAF